jgi:acid phosphatase (class A)
MLPSVRLLVACCAALCAALPALAAEPYLTAGTLDLAALLPPPPPKDSAAGAADMQAVLDAQAHASGARKAQAATDAGESVDVMFREVLGPKFVLADLPRTTAFFARVGATESVTVDAAKKVFGRVRPWKDNPAVAALPKPSNSPGYPSGHTTRVTMDAIALSAMVPEKQREIWLRADDYAESRVIAGEHYPTDVLAGWRSGTAVAAVIGQQAAFKQDFAAARAELRAALGLDAEPAK